MALEPTNNSLAESLIPLGGKRAIFLKKLKEFQLSGFEKQVEYCSPISFYFLRKQSYNKIIYYTLYQIIF